MDDRVANYMELENLKEVCDKLYDESIAKFKKKKVLMSEKIDVIIKIKSINT